MESKAMSDGGKKRALSFVTEIDQNELTVRLMEIGIGLVRTDKEIRTAAQIVADARRAWPEGMVTGFPFERMAVRALEYFRECIEKGQRPS
jgi:hypothetical protein